MRPLVGLRSLGWRLRWRIWRIAERRSARASRGEALDTGGVIDLDEFGLAAPERVQYQPSQYTMLSRGLRGCHISERDVFLDYGCGKGRVVVQAALRYRFRKVIGVEISAELAHIARRNLEVTRPEFLAGETEIVVADAETWPLPDEVTFVYMYRPFKGELFATVMQRVVESLDRLPRRLTLVYAHPEQDAVVLGTGRFARVRTSESPDRTPYYRVNVYVSEADRPGAFVGTP